MGRTDYYFYPIVWEAGGYNNMLEVIKTGRGIFKQYASHAEAAKIAKAKEVEINGKEFSIEEICKTKKSMTQVMFAPYSSARDYIHFHTWPCNNEVQTDEENYDA